MNGEARAATLRAFGKPSARWWAAVGFLGAIVAVGLYAWIVQLRNGMGAAGFNDRSFWALDIANVVTFIGVSYGGAVVSAILRLTGATWRAPLTRLAEGMAVCTVLIGGALIIPHIGRPDRLYELVTQPNVTAPVFWDFIAVMTYTAASVVFFTLPLIPDMALLRAEAGGRLGRVRSRLFASVSRGWVGAPRQRRVLAGALGLVSIMIIPLAVSVHSVLAWAFSTTSRPWWHESIWAPQFVVAALYSGVALVILVVAGFRRGYHLEAFIGDRHFVRLGFILATLGAAYLYFTFADILPGAYVADDSTSTIFGELLVGRLAGWFWLFIIAGGVVPLLLVALPWTRNTAGMVLAAALVVPMMWLKRLLMVVAPANLDVVSETHGSYSFTWVAIAITLAALAAVPLMLMLLFRVVPLLSIDEIEEVEVTEGRKTAESAAARRRHTAGRRIAQPDVDLVGSASSARRASGIALVLLMLAILGASGVRAAGPAAATPSGAPNITLTGVEAAGTVQLTAKVTDAVGAPITAGEVTFLLATSVFGPRHVQLGSVVPDETGTARLVLGGSGDDGWRPTSVGPHEFVASFTARIGDQPVQFSTNVDVTAARSAYAPAAPKALEGAAAVLVQALFLVVLIVWVLLATQVIRVLRVCRHAPEAGLAAS